MNKIEQFKAWLAKDPTRKGTNSEEMWKLVFAEMEQLGLKQWWKTNQERVFYLPVTMFKQWKEERTDSSSVSSLSDSELTEVLTRKQKELDQLQQTSKKPTTFLRKEIKLLEKLEKTTQKLTQTEKTLAETEQELTELEEDERISRKIITDLEAQN